MSGWQLLYCIVVAEYEQVFCFLVPDQYSCGCQDDLQEYLENGDHTEEVTDDDDVLEQTDDSVDNVLEEKCPEKDLIPRTDHHACCVVGVLEVVEDDWKKFLTRMTPETFVTVARLIFEELREDVQKSKRPVCLVFVTIVAV